MEYFLQQLINGLTLGAIYGLIAIGYTMVYGIIGMINFAHGEIFMIGSFLALLAFMVLGVVGTMWLPLGIVVVLIIAILLTAAYGWTLERIAYKPLRGASRLAPLISAIGMSIFLQNYVQLLQTARVRTLPPIIKGGVELVRTTTETGAPYAVSLSYLQIFIITTTLSLMAVFTLVILFTPLGRAQR